MQHGHQWEAQSLPPPAGPPPNTPLTRPIARRRQVSPQSPASAAGQTCQTAQLTSRTCRPAARHTCTCSRPWAAQPSNARPGPAQPRPIQRNPAQPCPALHTTTPAHVMLMYEEREGESTYGGRGRGGRRSKGGAGDLGKEVEEEMGQGRRDAKALLWVSSRCWTEELGGIRSIMRCVRATVRPANAGDKYECTKTFVGHTHTVFKAISNGVCRFKALLTTCFAIP